MNPFEQYSLEELQQRTSEKWRNYGQDVLPLWVAEMDVKLPDPLVEHLGQIIASGDVGYLSMSNFKRYAQAMADFSTRHWGWTPNVETIADCADVVSGCKRVIDAFLQHDADNTVVISTPVYPPFINGYTKGYKNVDVPLLQPDYSLDFPALENAFKQATENGHRAVYALCNPANPSGAVWGQTELSKLAELANSYGVLVVSDEIHGPLVTERNFEHDGHTLQYCDNPTNHGKHSSFVPYLSLANAGLAVCVTSASKGFSIPGMKAALIIPSDDLRSVNLINNSGHFGKATSEQLGAQAQTICYSECDDWLFHLVQGVRNNFDCFDSLMKRYLPLAKYKRPQGTYFGWIDFSEYVHAGKISGAPSVFFRDKAKVALNPGRTFAGPQKLNWSGMPVDGRVTSKVTPYDNYCRINLATSQEIIRMAVERMADALDS
ncbi:MAG: aminotransferase class I/II-fold pyridoxal phosphate-dependent enzyme [Candidatus Ancillula sp.]|nr:aminotransferase class I/II-fold pyridoxal phosphate-dependent enzyme [Candidatus Ancillula sp.]